MEINELNACLFNQTITIKARIVASFLSHDGVKALKLQALHAKTGEMPLFIGAKLPADIEIDENDLYNGPKLITGDYICQKQTKNLIFIPYLIIHKIEQYELNDSENNDTISEEEECNEKQFFTVENLQNLKFKTGDEFFECLQKNAYAQGFKLSCSHAKDDKYVTILCYQHNSKSPIYQACQFRINLQAHSYKTPNQIYEITKTICLEHTHPCDKFLFCHLILKDETIATIKCLSECNIDNIKIAEYIEKVKGIFMTTSQIRYILNQEKKQELISETECLDRKMKEEGGLSIIKSPDKIGTKYSFRRAIATFTQNELLNLENYGDIICLDPTYCSLKSNWSIIPLTVVGNSRQILSCVCIFCSNVTSDIYSWILYLLSYQLPCAQIIKTICSDDDVCLDSAFIKLSTDPIISSLNRIICIWHKLQQFKELVKKCNLQNLKKMILFLNSN